VFSRDLAKYAKTGWLGGYGLALILQNKPKIAQIFENGLVGRLWLRHPFTLFTNGFVGQVYLPTYSLDRSPGIKWGGGV
jgi:hypothetical protein